VLCMPYIMRETFGSQDIMEKIFGRTCGMRVSTVQGGPPPPGKYLS